MTAHAHLFCPVCDGPLLLLDGLVATPRRGHLEVRRDRLLVCPFCPVTLQVEWSTGRVMTIEGLTLPDLEMPWTPACSPRPVRNLVAHLHGRRDS